MRLIITAIVCSLLTVGGFFAYKQYGRMEKKEEARAYVVMVIDHNATSFNQETEADAVQLMDRVFDEVFGNHYDSGGLTKPAEFDEVNFARELFDVMYDRSLESEYAPETRSLVKRLYIQSRPHN